MHISIHIYINFYSILQYLKNVEGSFRLLGVKQTLNTFIAISMLLHQLIFFGQSYETGKSTLHFEINTMYIGLTLM